MKFHALYPLTVALLGGALGASAQAQTAPAAPAISFYGKFDIGARRAISSNNQELATSGDSRFGIKASTVVQPGLTAFAQLEHRYFPDTGVTDGSQFWKGIAVGGVQGAFGKLAAGRQYTAAFSLVQNQIDPFGGDTVAQLRDVAMRVGGITKVRVDGSLRFDTTVQGVNLALSLAEAEKNGGTRRPMSVGANYKVGALMLAAGVEDPANPKDKQWNLGASYKLGDATLSAGLADGTTSAGAKAKGWMLGLNLPVATGGTVKAAYGEQKRDGASFAKKLGLGYHHPLSDAFTLYADVGHDSKATTRKTGYDLGFIFQF